MPLLGFGVYQNYDTKNSVLEAFKAGYRHIDSAQAYRNEAAVADAVRESGLNRGDVFISTHHVRCIPYHSVLRLGCQASKCISRSHGYEQTLKGVNESLARMKFGMTKHYVQSGL
jgi:diketogulonate reductase-like aldo/keto reductase